MQFDGNSAPGRVNVAADEVGPEEANRDRRRTGALTTKCWHSQLMTLRLAPCTVEYISRSAGRV